ncbi:matrix metalloproteinase-27-like [Crotalus tigris]|uniref:matrix metalloproteinase-27-like n=1 Tax=Crotalus tigris TaxID=88082 RepID=UPI00192F147D|nr:matrix metalloproteinase-27-like [Crotalus tigris]
MKHILLLFWCIAFSYGLPILSEKRSEGQNQQLAQAYINQFYEQKADPRQRGWKINNLSFVDKIKQMQNFFRLNVTGKVDAETLEVMQQPRCGVPDIGQYVLALPGWRKTKLTYRIMNYTPDMRRADVDASIKKAFEVWSKVTPLTFNWIRRGRADIMIEFATRVHGHCPRQFDGPLGVLGHAFPPGHYFRGNVHFDEDETWVASLYEQRRSRNYPVAPADDVRTPVLKKAPKLHSSAVPLPYSIIKFNLFLVAAHEIGHVLGLAHSNDPRALMFPNYKPIDPDDSPLSEDDINAIQAIYGPSQNPSNEPVKPTVPKACDPKLNFDAITTFRREVIFFKGRNIWRVYPTNSEVDMESISTLSPLLPSGIQAAYENMNDQFFFFKGNKFWMISGLQMQPGYPQSIDKLGFPTNTEKIDAAVFDKDTRKTYFFVGNHYWRYDENTQSMDEGYPRNIRDDFPAIDEKIDAVFQLNGFFYFFHGSKQWEFDPKTKRVIGVMKSNSWLNC